MDMKLPRNISEVQRLTRWVVALDRFVARSTDKCLSFFKVLLTAQSLDDECGQAFRKLKEYLFIPARLS